MASSSGSDDAAVRAVGSEHADSFEASLEEEDMNAEAENRARTAANLAALDVVDALRRTEEQQHLAKAARREQSWREHQDDPQHSPSWRRLAKLARHGTDGKATVDADAEPAKESLLPAQQEPHSGRMDEVHVVEEPLDAPEGERVPEPVMMRTDRLPHSHRMANELYTVEQSLANASIALEHKIAGRRRRCASADPGCMCLRLSKVSNCIGTTDLRIWLDTLLKQQQRQLKQHRGVHSGSDKAILKVMTLKGLMARASRIPGLAKGLCELTEQLHEFHAHLLSGPMLCTGSRARFKADAVKQMESIALKVGLCNDDLEDAVDDLLASWSQSTAVQQRDVAPRKLATTALIRAELKIAKEAASLLTRRDIPRTECAIRSLVNGRHKMRSARLQRLSQPDPQRIYTAAAKRSLIVEERRRRVGGNAPRCKKAPTERQHKTTAAGARRSARHVQSARRDEVKIHSRALHKPHPPSKPHGHLRASTAPRGAKSARTTSVMAGQDLETEWRITGHPHERHDDSVAGSALPPYPSKADRFYDEHQRIKIQREVQDAEIAQMRADEDGLRRAERETGAWGLQSDWEIDGEILQTQRVADDQCLQTERDEEDHRAKLAYGIEIRQQAPNDAVVPEQEHEHLSVSQASFDNSTGSQATPALASGSVSSSGNTELSSVLRLGPGTGKTDNSAYEFSDGQLKAARAPHGRVALCTDTEIKDSHTSAAFTIVQSQADTPAQLLLGLAERNIDVEKDLTPATNRFFGISSLDGSLVSSGWHARWEGQQGFCVGDTVELLVLAAAGNVVVKKNDKLLGVATIPGGLLPSAGDLCWAVSLGDVGDTVTARSTDASQFEAGAPRRPTVSTTEQSKMHLRLDLLEAQLSARKQRRQEQARVLYDIHNQIKERESCKAKSDLATEPKASIKGVTSTDAAAVVPRSNNSRFGGPVATLGTSTRSGIGSINGGKQVTSKVANDVVFAKLKQLQSASAKLSLSKPAPEFRVLRSREPLPEGFALVTPDLAEKHKSVLVHSLALQTSGTWHSAEIADGFRIVNVANSSRGQPGWTRLSEAAEETTEQAVFSTIVAAVATDRRAAAANNASTVDSSLVAAASDISHSIQRTDLQKCAPYHFGEGVVCSHSPYGTTISDVWYGREEESLPSTGERLSLGNWHELLRAVKRRLGGYMYRAFLVGLAWETGASRRLRQASTALDGEPGTHRASPLKDGVYPVIHAIFDQDHASGRLTKAASNNPVVALKVCVLESDAVALGAAPMCG